MLKAVTNLQRCPEVATPVKKNNNTFLQFAETKFKAMIASAIVIYGVD